MRLFGMYDGPAKVRGMSELPNNGCCCVVAMGFVLLLYNENPILAHSGLSFPADIKRHVRGDMPTPAGALYRRTQKTPLLIC